MTNIQFEELENINENLVYIGNTPSQYKSAIIGLSHDDNHIIYSYDKLMKAMMEQDEMTSEEATEWIEYNTIRSLNFIKEYAPIIIYTVDNYND